MKTTISEIKKVTVEETFKGETVFIEIEEEKKENKRTVTITAPLLDDIDGSCRIQFGDFREDVPFETFVDDVESQIRNDVDDGEGLSVESIFHSLANMYSSLESFGKIVIDLSENFGGETDYRNFVKKYDKFYIWNNDTFVSKMDNIIRYNEPLFFATFLKNGELIGFDQPDVRKEMTEKQKNKVIKKIRKKLF